MVQGTFCFVFVTFVTKYIYKQKNKYIYKYLLGALIAKIGNKR